MKEVSTEEQEMRVNTSKTYNPIPKEIHEEVLKAYKEGHCTYTYIILDNVHPREVEAYWKKRVEYVNYVDVNILGTHSNGNHRYEVYIEFKD